MGTSADNTENKKPKSYCYINIGSPKLMEILKKHKDLFEIEFLKECEIEINDTEFEFETEFETDKLYLNYEVPDKKECLADGFADFITELSKECNEQDKFKCLIDEINENSEEIKDTITLFSFEQVLKGKNMEIPKEFLNNLTKANDRFVVKYVKSELNNEEYEKITHFTIINF